MNANQRNIIVYNGLHYLLQVREYMLLQNGLDVVDITGHLQLFGALESFYTIWSVVTSDLNKMNRFVELMSNFIDQELLR